MILLLVLGFNVCVVVALFAYVAVGCRPNGARLALCFTGAGVGGVAAFLLFAPMIGTVDKADELAGFLVEQGPPRRISEWLLIYIA